MTPVRTVATKKPSESVMSTALARSSPSTRTVTPNDMLSRIELERSDLLVVYLGRDDPRQGLSLVREASAQRDGPKAIVITGEMSPLVDAVLAAGASACVDRSADPDDLAFANPSGVPAHGLQAGEEVCRRCDLTSRAARC